MTILVVKFYAENLRNQLTLRVANDEHIMTVHFCFNLK